MPRLLRSATISPYTRSKIVMRAAMDLGSATGVGIVGVGVGEATGGESFPAVCNIVTTVEQTEVAVIAVNAKETK